MAFDINNPYFRTKVLTATPEELRLMLLDGALHFVAIGREGLGTKNYEKVFEGFSQSKAIVMELINSLRPEHAPDLCKRMASLYTYIYRLLMEASFEKSDDKAAEAQKLLEYERETWAMLLERLASERTGAAPGAPAASATGTDGRAPLSLSA
jgi:flagellar secretion chaperone FliS